MLRSDADYRIAEMEHDIGSVLDVERALLELEKFDSISAEIVEDALFGVIPTLKLPRHWASRTEPCGVIGTRRAYSCRPIQTVSSAVRLGAESRTYRCYDRS